VCAQASVLCGSSATVLSSFVIVLPSGGTLVCLHVHEYKNTRSKTDFTIYKNLYMQKVTQYIHVFVIKCLFGSSAFSVTWLCNIRQCKSYPFEIFQNSYPISFISYRNWNSSYNVTESRRIALSRSSVSWISIGIKLSNESIAVEKRDSHCKDGGVQTGAGLAEGGSSEGTGSSLWVQDEMNDRWKRYCRMLVLPVSEHKTYRFRFFQIQQCLWVLWLNWWNHGLSSYRNRWVMTALLFVRDRKDIAYFISHKDA